MNRFAIVTEEMRKLHTVIGIIKKAITEKNREKKREHAQNAGFPVYRYL